MKMAKRLTIEEQIKQTEHRLATLKARSREQERKERTRNLIKLGGIVLKNIGDGRPYEEGDDVRLDAFLKNQNERGDYFTKAMAAATNPTVAPHSGRMD
jgi:hypothetical protein